MNAAVISIKARNGVKKIVEAQYRGFRPYSRAEWNWALSHFAARHQLNGPFHASHYESFRGRQSSRFVEFFQVPLALCSVGIWAQPAGQPEPSLFSVADIESMIRKKQISHVAPVGASEWISVAELR